MKLVYAVIMKYQSENGVQFEIRALHDRREDAQMSLYEEVAKGFKNEDWYKKSDYVTILDARGNLVSDVNVKDKRLSYFRIKNTTGNYFEEFKIEEYVLCEKNEKTLSLRERVPSLDNVLSFFMEVKKFIKEHQGEKGFINVSNDLLGEPIFSLSYDHDCDGDACYIEQHVTAVRVKDGKLELLIDAGWGIDDEEIFECDDECWTDITDAANVFTNTLYSIASSIEEHVRNYEQAKDS